MGSGNDDAVLEELHRRMLSDEKRDALEGPITKDELTNQLKHHMKPNSSPGLDCFTVTWVRHFWDDLAVLCVSAVNNSYEQKYPCQITQRKVPTIFYPFLPSTQISKS